MGRGYGYNIAYPKVPAERIREIYKQSHTRIIYGYGFFVDPQALYDKKYPNSVSFDHYRKFEDKVKSDLCAAGLDKMSITSDYPTPGWFRDTCDEEGCWLVVLVTGFEFSGQLQPHAPVAEELVQRVQDILNTNEEPSWWPMMEFMYPSPNWWIADMEQVQ
ncbi:unnamed protein product [Rhizoctonia solani]|uniref:Uncharacterized protein n=1 Tax=Rhizoctonia solani TaxID=456999 RepID=A0A8H3BX67_9AGAM|nr:unnamed protein product [Rhizoctonia solani]CAE7218971.1 unnamed protein product [Rhizoctonia solani]